MGRPVGHPARHDVVPLDYGNDPGGSREIINDWVSDRTDALIPELLPDGLVDPGTVLVLTDTIYFAADWATPFGKYGTVDGTFTTLDGTEVDVSFMRELELGDRRGIGDGFAGAAIHAADITVDEQGTVAAAATALGFRTSGPPEPELTIAADRPFLYLIRHRDSGLVLFAGHVTDPT